MLIDTPRLREEEHSCYEGGRRPAVSFNKVLAEVSKNKLVLRLFELSEADYRDPVEWYDMLVILAAYIDGSYLPNNGRPVKFDRPSKRVLAKDFREIAAKNPARSATAILGRMIEQQSRYKDISLSTLKNAFKASGISTADLLKRVSAAQRVTSQKRGRRVVAR